MHLADQYPCHNCVIKRAMGIYFIEDPDGYWIEIVPERK